MIIEPHHLICSGIFAVEFLGGFIVSTRGADLIREIAELMIVAIVNDAGSLGLRFEPWSSGNALEFALAISSVFHVPGVLRPRGKAEV